MLCHLKIARLAVNATTEKRMQSNMSVGIVMLDHGQLCAHLDIQIDFFTKLSPQTITGRLSGLDFSSGQLPIARIDDVVRSASDKNAPTVIASLDQYSHCYIYPLGH